MTNDEIRNIMEFIIKQQETFAANMGKAEARMSLLDRAFVGLFDVVTKTANAQKELAEAQRRTDERLNALINTVERYISDGRNGRPQG